MKSDNLIPRFKRKELSLEYLSDSFEDEARCRFKSLWSTINDFGVDLDLSQIVSLVEYEVKANQYLCELISLLTGEGFKYLIKRDMEKFRESYSPESKADLLIFKIFKRVFDELIWVESILEMEERKLIITGDNDE